MKNTKLEGCNEIDVNNAVMNGAFEGPKIYRQIEKCLNKFQLSMHFSSPRNAMWLLTDAAVPLVLMPWLYTDT